MSRANLKIWLDSILSPLIVALFIPLATTFGSKLANGSWSLWFEEMPEWVLFSLIGGLLAWVVLALIVNQKKKVSGLIGAVSLAMPSEGYESIGSIDFKGVTWSIKGPKRTWSSYSNEEYLGFVSVFNEPRCVSCRTELIQKSAVFYGFIWKCPMCGFQRFSRRKFSYHFEEVEKIARRKVEMQIEGGERKHRRFSESESLPRPLPGKGLLKDEDPDEA